MATITGTSANETLSGTGADDTIIGLGGNDTLTGGGGRNTFSYTARQFGQDTITDFTLGLDRIDLTALGIAEFSLLQSFLTQSSLDTVLTFSYNGQTESITFRNILPAQLGAADFVFNTSTAGLSQTGTSSSDVLFGGLGNDTLDGGFGNDQLLGGSGADILIGGASNDQLTGGNGNDNFTYNARGFGADTVLDFTQGQDRIDLSAIGIAEFSALQPFITQSGLDTVITLTYNGAPETITLRGIQPGQLSASDFIFNTALTALTLTGTSSTDVLFGGNGNDSLSGGFGNDTLHGGQGTDLINGGASNDLLTGGGGNDLFVYNDRAFGVDTITDFTLGQDRLDFSVVGIGDLTTLLPYISQVGANAVISFTYNGAAETITLQNVQANQLTAANFLFNGSTNALTVSGTNSTDVLFGGLGNDTLNGGFGNDTLTAGQGNDNLIGGASDDALIGAAGNDLFTYDARQFGDDTVLDFTLGQDRLNFSTIGIGSLDVLQPFIAQVGADTVFTMGYGGSTESITLRNITPSQLTAANFVFATVTSPVTITGTGFDDTLFGGSAADTLNGSFGNDKLSGGQGDDTLIGGSGSDALFGGGGNDRMEGGTGDDVYYIESAGDQVVELVGEGIDTVVSSINHYLLANTENLRLAAGSGNLYGVGNELANALWGNESGNLLVGGSGNDTLDGDAGNDQLFGEAGADSMIGGDGIDYMAGGADNDTMHGGNQADELYGEGGNDTLTGGSDFVTDILVGGAGDDILDASSGLGDYDILNGGSGNDTFYVDTPDDIIYEAAGDGIDTVIAGISGAGYYLWANVENAVLTGATPFAAGNALDNVLTGSTGANWLLGNDGNDTLNGKAGNDVLFGDRPGGTAGHDTFVFETGAGADVIGDFHHGEDTIRLLGIYSSFAQAQTHFIQNGADGAIDLGGGNIVVLQGVTMSTLTSGDFLFA